MKRNAEGVGETCEGHVIVYVDDIMVMACDQVRTDFFRSVAKGMEMFGSGNGQSHHVVEILRF